MHKRAKLCYLSILLASALFLSACSANGLSGVYISESNTYSVDFEADGTCTWYQGGSFFTGTYEKDGEFWKLEITGSGTYANTVFIATPSNGDLIIEGGTVNGERFIKQ